MTLPFKELLKWLGFSLEFCMEARNPWPQWHPLRGSLLLGERFENSVGVASTKLCLQRQ